MTRLVDPLDLVDSATIAKRLGVSKGAVTAWRGRSKTFPHPVEVPGLSYFVYSWEEIFWWYDTFKGGERISLRSALVQVRRVEHDEHGTVYYTWRIKRRGRW